MPRSRSSKRRARNGQTQCSMAGVRPKSYFSERTCRRPPGIRCRLRYSTMTQNAIDTETLRQWLEQGRPLIVLDVRTAADRAEWAIPGSRHVDAYAALRANDSQALKAVALPHSRTRVVQVRRTGKGCLSYLIGADGEAAVIDAAVDAEVYLDLARQEGWRISAVLDTHIHADHLSRSGALAEQSGATLYLPAQERITFSFSPLVEGDTLAIGSARLTALHTPGHTAESTSYLLDEQALFTGDTLFLNAVGRPDLHADQVAARARAHALYASIQRLLALPPETLVLPGHTSAPIPFDRQPIAATLDQVHAATALLRVSEGEFVEALLARIPPTPPNHARIIELNEAGASVDNPTHLEAGANRCAIA